MYCPTYSSSTISLRTSFSLNEYSYYSNERCPSSYCSCCCSNLSRYIVPIVNPSFSYGLRQSRLIQRPPSRRLTFGSRSPVSDVGLCCNGEWCCGKRDRVDKNKYCCEKVSVNRQQLLPMYVPLTRGVGRSRCKSITFGEGGSKMSVNVNVNVNVNRIRDSVARRNYRCNALGDAEAILSLLTEEPVEQLLDVRGRGSRSSKDGNEFCVDSRFKKENLQSGYLGGQSGRHRVELAERKSEEEVNKRREEREALLKNEERRSRRKESSTWDSGSLLDKVNLVSSNVQSKQVSYGTHREEDMDCFSREEERWSRRNESGSSYYSTSNMSDLESDTEVEIRDERLAEESSVRYGKDSKQTGNVVIKDEMKKELGRYRVGSYVACNSKENTEGIVISNKEKRESEWNKDVKNHQELQSHKHDEVKVGSVTEWDWRNKSEKRFTEESTEETKSRKDSVVRHFMKSSRPEQFNHREEGSTSGASFHGQFISHIEKDNQVSELSKSSARRHEQTTQTARHNIELTSDIQGRSNQGEESMVIVGQSVQETGCKYCETCRKIMQENKTQTGFQQMSELSEIHNDAKWTSTVQSESESRLRKQEKSSTSLQTSVQEENYLLDQMRTQNNSVTVDSQDNYVEGTLSSQQQSDVYKKSLEEMSSLLVIRQEGEGSKKTSDHKFSDESESSRVAPTGISVSQVRTTKAEINRQSASEHHSETIYAHDNYAEDTSSSRQEILSSVISQGVKELQEKVGREVIKEIESSRVGQTGTSSSLVDFTNAEINHWSASNQHIYDEQIYSTKVKSEEVLVEKHKHIDETNVQSRVRTEIQRPITEDTYAGNLSGEATVSQPSIALISQIGLQHLSEGEASVYINPQARTSSSSTKLSSGSESYEDPSRGDSLGSAERMEESSVQIVGGFIEDMRHEASTQDSQRQTGTGSESQARIASSHELSGGRNEPYEEASHEYALVLAERMDESSVQIVGEFVDKMQHEASTSQSTHQESRRSSGNSETKGPSDEMWDAKDHFAQESSERDSSKNTVSENVTVRTGKSLWNILAGVLRLQSVSTAKTQKSSSKSSGHGSSNESVSGEACSSEDEANGKIVKRKDKTSVPQDPSPRNQRDDRMSHLEVGASSSSNVLQTSSFSAGVSYGVNPIFNVTQETSQSSPLDITVSTEIASEVTNVEPKQTKLQRANQVLHERYYEWEDAYRREREEKEADEKFMREALVEAKKAADSWEVPVGAVLVQNGNVIARGYNLVEELRDSTAHAEMICIREASNVLQTWRLSETTLYVTLEPCPMCAGAILQARVGTLVWGAPNKLLGADGSWIRLFRDGLEGEERAEVADKPVAPVHPFHTSMKIRRGVLESECADIMQQFFHLRRRKEKASQQEPTQTPKLSHKLFKFPLIHRKRSS